MESVLQPPRGPHYPNSTNGNDTSRLLCINQALSQGFGGRRAIVEIHRAAHLNVTLLNSEKTSLESILLEQCNGSFQGNRLREECKGDQFLTKVGEEEPMFLTFLS